MSADLSTHLPVQHALYLGRTAICCAFHVNHPPPFGAVAMGAGSGPRPVGSIGAPLRAHQALSGRPCFPTDRILHPDKHVDRTRRRHRRTGTGRWRLTRVGVMADSVYSRHVVTGSLSAGENWAAMELHHRYLQGCGFLSL